MDFDVQRRPYHHRLLGAIGEHGVGFGRGFEDHLRLAEVDDRISTAAAEVHLLQEQLARNAAHLGPELRLKSVAGTQTASPRDCADPVANVEASAEITRDLAVAATAIGRELTDAGGTEEASPQSPSLGAKWFHRELPPSPPSVDEGPRPRLRYRSATAQVSREPTEEHFQSAQARFAHYYAGAQTSRPSAVEREPAGERVDAEADDVRATNRFRKHHLNQPRRTRSSWVEGRRHPKEVPVPRIPHGEPQTPVWPPLPCYQLREERRALADQPARVGPDGPLEALPGFLVSPPSRLANGVRAGFRAAALRRLGDGEHGETAEGLGARCGRAPSDLEWGAHCERRRFIDGLITERRARCSAALEEN